MRKEQRTKFTRIVVIVLLVAFIFTLVQAFKL